MLPVRVPLNDHTHGDTWEGIASIGPVLINGSQPDYALSSCRMYFRTTLGVLGYKFKSSPGDGEGSITISDADTWEITVAAQALPLDIGMWEWDFETTDSDGTILTLYSGTLEIVEEQSYD